jgi:hypothetical protein
MEAQKTFGARKEEPFAQRSSLMGKGVQAEVRVRTRFERAYTWERRRLAQCHLLFLFFALEGRKTIARGEQSEPLDWIELEKALEGRKKSLSPLQGSSWADLPRGSLRSPLATILSPLRGLKK